MNEPAALRATFSDWKLIKTRGVVQLCFEVPIEQAGLAYKVLGGMPNPAAEVWCGIARLQPAKEVIEKPRPAPHHAPKTGGAHRSFHEMSAAQQSGMLCSDPAFINFLTHVAGEPIKTKDDAAAWVRWQCGVDSRAELDRDNGSKMRWNNLVLDYRAYMREPAVVPA